MSALFWSRVDKDGPVHPVLGTKCWKWTGTPARVGYGRLGAGSRGKRIYAHRFSYELHHGSIDAELCVLHRCDNRLCVNPDHLFLGTRQDNMMDKVAKGRQSHTRGEAAGNAKLTEEQVLDIRRRSAMGVQRTRLAREYGVSPSAIYEVATLRTWAHLV